MKKTEALFEIEQKVETVKRWIEILKDTSTNHPNHKLFATVLKDSIAGLWLKTKEVEDFLSL